MQFLKTTKTLLVFTSILIIAGFSSCKKDKKVSPPSGSMTASIDGKSISFSTHTMVVTGSVNDVNFTAIQGNASDGSTMSVTVNGTLTAGTTYTSSDPDPGNEPVLLYGLGNDNYMNGINNPSVNVTITAVSSSSIQGTFSGTVTDMTSGTDKVITAGKFNVPRQ